MKNTMKEMNDLFNANMNPIDIFNKLTNMASNSQEILENNMKYHKACINYHQSLHDMMEAINDNANLINGTNDK